jgi:hypothetical protein
MAGRDRGPDSGQSAPGIRWWDKSYKGDKERADACFRWLARVMTRQTIRRRMHLVNLRMYEDMPSIGLGPYTFTVYDPGDDTLRMNLVRAVVDTWVPLVGRSKPKPQALTQDGDWSLKKRAKGLSRWLEGKWQEMEVYRDLSMPCLRDTGVFGLGCALNYRSYLNDDKHTDVDCERVFPWEVVADEVEAQAPKYLRTMARRRLIDRQQAADMFPAAEDYILHRAPRYSPGSNTFDFAVESTSDMVQVSEFWRLPSTKESKDGLHVIACPGKTLFEAKWTRTKFPIKFLYRSRPSQGIWGVSIPTELRGLQVHINTTLLDYEECVRLYGKPKWMYQAGTVDPNFLDDEVDTAIPYHGQVPPTVYSPPPGLHEMANAIWPFWQKGFEQIGVSNSRSQGEVPEGLSGSGASIRAWNDVEDGRTYEAATNCEDWHMQLAEEQIEIARDVAEVRHDYSTVLRGKTTVQIVKFKDVDPGQDNYYLRVFPISRLSTAPAQRLAQIQELFNAGLIDKEQFRELLNFPDLEAEENLMNAPRELAEKLISKFLEADDPDAEDVFEYPEAEWPLAQLKVRFQYAEVRARLDCAPEGNVRLLRLFMSLCDKEMAKATQPAAAPPGPPGAGPPGAPPPPGMAGPPGAPQLAPPPPPLPGVMPGQTAH